MPSKNPEIRLLVRILAIIGIIVILIATGGYLFLKIKAPHLLKFSKDFPEYRAEVDLDSLAGAQFITGMNGCENMALSPDNMDVYVSCLDGNIYLLSKNASGNYAVIKSCKPGNQSLGLTFGRDGMLYANVGEGHAEDWTTRGGGVFRISRALDRYERLTKDYRCINGLASDNSGNLYFTGSNYKFLNPKGEIYKMDWEADGYGLPELFMADDGLSNGLYFDPVQDLFYYSNTIGGVYQFRPGDPSLHAVYLKLRFMEACDDLCTDVSGNVWMTDPGYGTLKMFNPGTGRLFRFNVHGIGQASSVRIRQEHGVETLYITELKRVQKPMKPEFDGRGVLIVPAASLIRLLEPQLIQKP